MQSGHGCTTLFSDDLVLDDVTIKGNQGNGFYAQGIDSNAGSMINSSYYYNVLWGVEDQSALGNNWFGNQISNNGSAVGGLDYSDDKEHQSIARTLGTGGQRCFGSARIGGYKLKAWLLRGDRWSDRCELQHTAGQCFFITSYTDSTHFSYIQPGAPADASSSAARRAWRSSPRRT
jgi:hypothetical protein